MDWQQVVSLGIVGVTAAVFVWQRMRPRKLGFAQVTHCGCSAAGQAKNSITIQGRRGERPKVIVKM